MAATTIPTDRTRADVTRRLRAPLRATDAPEAPDGTGHHAPDSGTPVATPAGRGRPKGARTGAKGAAGHRTAGSAGQRRRRLPARADDRQGIALKLQQFSEKFGVTLPALPVANTLTMAMRHLGRDTFLSYVALAANNQDEHAVRFCTCWMELTERERATISLDAVCQAAGIPVVEMVRSISGVAFDVNVDVAEMISAVAHPQVVSAAVKAAKNVTYGHKDRKLLMSRYGYGPKVGRPSVVVNNSNNVQANAAARAGESKTLNKFGADMDDVMDASRDVHQRRIEGT